MERQVWMRDQGGCNAGARRVQGGCNACVSITEGFAYACRMDTEIIVKRLEQIILEVVPDAATVLKYGGTLYTLAPEEKEGQFCGVFPYAKHVQLSFTRGDRLDDPAGLLDGGGKYRRHMNFADVADIPIGDVKAFVKQAVRSDRS